MLLLYPANFAASSSLGAIRGVRDALRMIQDNYIDPDTYKIEAGKPFITILDLAMQLQELARIDSVTSIQIILQKISRLVLVRYNKEGVNSRDALLWVMSQDHRLGVWCACQVAREALRYVPSGERRPLRAIEAAEGWVRGETSIKDVQSASSAAASASYASSASAASAAAAADAAYAACYAASAASYASSASSAPSASYAAYTAAASARRDELRRLTSVVANAILTFPV